MLPHLHLTTVSTVMGAQLHGWIIKNFWLLKKNVVGSFGDPRVIAFWPGIKLLF